MSLNEQNRGKAVTYHFAFDDHGNGKTFISMMELAKLIATCATVQREGAKVEETQNCQDYTPRENPILGLDCTKTRDVLKWRPARPFKDCIRAMCHWHHPDRSAVERKVMLRDTIEGVMKELLAQCPRNGVQRVVQPASCPYVKRGVPCFNSILEESGAFQK